MDNVKRKFLNSVFTYSSAIGLYKTIPVAHACGVTDDSPIYYPITHQLDLSHSPLTEYLNNFYDSKLPIQQNASLKIITKERAENSSVVPTQIEIPAEYFEKSFKNIECSRLDVFEQIMDGILERSIYRIASYTFASNTLPKISFRYKRVFSYSRLIAVGTLIDKTSKQKKNIIYNHTNTIRGGGPCNLTFPGPG